MSNATTIKDLLRTVIDQLKQIDCYAENTEFLIVDVASQQLMVCCDEEVLASYPVSTAAKGKGCQQDSLQTPTGVHRIAEKIGDGEPPAMIFEGRVPTGRIAEIHADNVDTEQDLITSRILWLEGLQAGINAGMGVDTHDRYIYIHGTNEEGRLGQPVSHGCVRLSNESVITLYERVSTQTMAVIV